MFRLWAKIFKENHLLKDVVICNDQEDTRTHKVFQALDEACYELDLTRPSGWTSISETLNAIPKHVLHRTASLSILILIIWKFRSLKKIKIRFVTVQPCRNVTQILNKGSVQDFSAWTLLYLHRSELPQNRYSSECKFWQKAIWNTSDRLRIKPPDCL